VFSVQGPGFIGRLQINSSCDRALRSSRSSSFLAPVLTEGESVKLVPIPLTSAVVEGEAVVFLFVVPELLHVSVAWTDHLWEFTDILSLKARGLTSLSSKETVPVSSFAFVQEVFANTVLVAVVPSLLFSLSPSRVLTLETELHFELLVNWYTVIHGASSSAVIQCHEVVLVSFTSSKLEPLARSHLEVEVVPLDQIKARSGLLGQLADVRLEELLGTRLLAFFLAVILVPISFTASVVERHATFFKVVKVPLWNPVLAGPRCSWEKTHCP